MNRDTILLDSNIIIYALKNNPTVFAFVNQKRLAVSFITEVELLGWKGITTNDRKLITSFLSECFYIDYNHQIKQRTIQLRQQYNLKIADAFLAATSIEFDIPFVSADVEFNKVKELSFILIAPTHE